VYNNLLRDAYDHEVITVSAVAIGLTANKLSPAEAALISCAGGGVRYWLDGTAPTASEGHPLAAGETILVHGQNNLRGLRFVRETADAALAVTYLR
jgi:hypothetical protein